MNQVLLINIDTSYRSLYSASVAQLFLQKDPQSCLTLITVRGNEVLSQTGLFEKIYFIDPVEFFRFASAASDEATEKEIVRFLTPVLGLEWSSVINLSSNLLGAYYTYFLNHKEIFGPHYKNDLTDLRQTNFHSYLLANLPNEHSSYGHISSLYKKLLNFSVDSGPRPFVLGAEHLEVQKRFSKLKVLSKRSGIILIDAGMKLKGHDRAISFLTQYFKDLMAGDKFLPVLLGHGSDAESFIVDRLRSLFPGEFHMVSADPLGLLCVLSSVSLVVTDDLALKTLSDLCLKPSIFIHKGEQLPVGDYSVTEGSHLFHVPDYLPDLGASVLEVSEKILGSAPLKKRDNEIKIYQTVTSNAEAVLEPLNGGGEAFTRFWLAKKYLEEKQNVASGTLRIWPEVYRSGIASETLHVTCDGAPKPATSFEEPGAAAGLPVTSSELLGAALRFSAYAHLVNGNAPVDRDQELEARTAEVLDFLKKELEDTLPDTGLPLLPVK